MHRQWGFILQQIKVMKVLNLNNIGTVTIDRRHQRQFATMTVLRRLFVLRWAWFSV